MAVRHWIAMMLSICTLLANDKSDWNALQAAKGWSRLDACGIATFYDAPSHTLFQWANGRMTNHLTLPKSLPAPQGWLMGADYAWVAEGTRLLMLDKAGGIKKSVPLPAEVGDMDVLPDGMVIAYKSSTPFIEKRHLTQGTLLWTHGHLSPRQDKISAVSYRITCDDTQHVLLMQRDDLFFTLLDGKKGTPLGQMLFTYQGNLPPSLRIGDQGRGPLVWDGGKHTAYCTLYGTQIPAMEYQGMLLTRLDIPTAEVTFFALDLAPDHHLIGVANQHALFTAPEGGLVYVPLAQDK